MAGLVFDLLSPSCILTLSHPLGNLELFTPWSKSKFHVTWSAFIQGTDMQLLIATLNYFGVNHEICNAIYDNNCLDSFPSSSESISVPASSSTSTSSTIATLAFRSNGQTHRQILTQSNPKLHPKTIGIIAR
jgi:hypothetical protein